MVSSLLRVDRMPSRPRGHPIHVTIVSDNPETIDGLEGYLRAAGAITQSTRELETSAQLVPIFAAAIVLFPDDFSSEVVFRTLADLRAKRPHALIVLVTREPRRFEALPSLDERVAPVVVPKPAWGWSILDAIRAHLGFETPSPMATKAEGRSQSRKRQGP